MQRALQDLLRKRMDRAIATVLSAKEQSVDPLLPHSGDARTASRHLRKVVLDQFNDFYEVCIDVMGSLDNGDAVLNEVWLEKLDEIHRAIVDDHGINLAVWAEQHPVERTG